MKILVILITLSSLFSCGINKKEIKSLKIPAEVKNYVQKFEANHSRKIDNLEMYFSSSMPTDKTVGYCTWKEVEKNYPWGTEFQETPQVYISQAYWDSYQSTPSLREQLVFHELGHCILLRKHDTTLLVNGYPSSIMYPYIMTEYVYLKNYSNYMSELFNVSVSNLAYVSYDQGYYASTSLDALKENINIEEVDHVGVDTVPHIKKTITYNEENEIVDVKYQLKNSIEDTSISPESSEN